jgi:hypothetical protein
MFAVTLSKRLTLYFGHVWPWKDLLLPQDDEAENLAIWWIGCIAV